MRRFLGSALFVCALGALSACNSGSTATYLVGGSVSGLTSGTLTLQINGGETVDISVDGTFTFPTKLAAGANYEITVADTPVGFLATVTNGTGTVAGTVTDVAIAVAERTYTVSGAVSGLNGTIVLQNNGGDDLTLVADGPFTFPTALANGATFNVTILSSPPGQNCTVVALEAGSVNGADVTGIAVVCLDHYTVGGSVNGLGNHVILRNNGSDEITVNANGPFTFPAPVVDGRSYEVTVVGGSTTQRYTVTNGTGQIAAGNVADVEIGATDKHWWHPAVPADNHSLDGSSADYGRVAIAGTGDCVVVWHQTDGSNSQIFMSSCRSGVWTDPSGPSDNVSPDGQDAWAPDVAMNASGDAVVAWSQTDGTESRIFVSLYRSGTWTHPTALTEGISPRRQRCLLPAGRDRRRRRRARRLDAERRHGPGDLRELAARRRLGSPGLADRQPEPERHVGGLRPGGDGWRRRRGRGLAAERRHGEPGLRQQLRQRLLDEPGLARRTRRAVRRCVRGAGPSR
jgi:predicted RecA/RadA family phage recombinase